MVWGMPLIPFIYFCGATITTLFITVVFLIIWYNNDHVKMVWTDIPLTLVCIAVWPIFWVLLVASKIFFNRGSK